jgi:3',5'-cyclic AMP phosphodiesterase CpdA
MKRLLHISDLHFGRIASDAVEALLNFVQNHDFDLALISGDLTQRARKEQFVEAKNFLKRLTIPQVIVPGNHDIPLYAIWWRFTAPFRHFRRHIHVNIEPEFHDKELSVIGLSTVSLWSIEGRFRKKSFLRIRKALEELPPERFRILLAHHPLPESVIPLLSPHLDLVLTGHTHVPQLHRGSGAKGGPLLLHAGTAISSRLRENFSNSFNVIEIQESGLRIAQWRWDPKGHTFRLHEDFHFARSAKGWVRRNAEA